jgi:Tfp pilus assembly protein PilF
VFRQRNIRARLEAIQKKCWLEILLFGIVLITGCYFFHPVDLDNVTSRLYMISSIADYGTLDIDRYKDRTLDTSAFGGHFYSNKAIGTAVLGVPVYWAMRHIPPFRNQPPLTSGQRYFVRVVTTTLPFAILAVVMLRLAIRLGAPPRVALWMACAYCFGTIALIHATVLTGHQTAASFGAFAFAILVGLRHDTSPPPRREAGLAFVAGMFAGLSALADYTAMFMAGVLTIYTLTAGIKQRSKLAFGLGAALCATLLAVYNWKCFGSALAVSYSYQTQETHRNIFDQAVFGFGWPTARALYGLLGSPSRGLFFIMPVFVFSLYGMFHWWKTQRNRAELYVILAIVFGYLAIVSSFRSWHGSQTYGPRFLVPMLPFLAIPMVFAGVTSKWFLSALTASVLLVAPAIIGLPETHESIQNPIIEEILPVLAQDYHSENVGDWLGIEFPGSVVPSVLLVLGFAWYASRRLADAPPMRTMSSVETAGIGAWLGYVAVLLITIRTHPVDWVARDTADAHYNMACALSAQGRVERAVAHFRAAVQANPSFPLANARLADLLAATGRQDDAIHYYRQALQARPDWPEVHHNLGLALARRGKLPEAIAHFSQVLQLDPQCEIAYVNLGLVYWKLNNPDSALTNLWQALALNPADDQAHYLLGLVLQTQGRRTEAAQQFTEALRLNPNQAGARLALKELSRSDSKPF